MTWKHDSDVDTNTKGVYGPYQPWEGDHTALVHVLWSARYRGLTLEDDADEIASMIVRSRWFYAAQQHRAPVGDHVDAR